MFDTSNLGKSATFGCRAKFDVRRIHEEFQKIYCPKGNTINNIIISL
jgi:hypothetical protein